MYAIRSYYAFSFTHVRAARTIASPRQTPRLDKMGGGAWEKAKVKARAAVEELARDLRITSYNVCYTKLLRDSLAIFFR